MSESKKSPAPKKLVLHKETLTKLNDEQTEIVVGGKPPTTRTCPEFGCSIDYCPTTLTD